MAFTGLTLAEYENKYDNVKFERDDAGVLTVTLHTGGDSLVWSAISHDEIAYAWGDIAADRANRVVVLTGAGDNFCNEIDFSSFSLATASDWADVAFHGQRLMNGLLDIPVPVVGAINGPARFHPELALFSDLTVASDTAVFQDAPHFAGGIAPGDGAQVAWMHILGPQRGRYFLLTGQEIDAEKALDWGVVNEVVPKDRVLARAHELAALLAAKPEVSSRYARHIVTREWKRLLHEQLASGLAHESLGVLNMMGS